MKRSLRYALRFQILPDANAERRARELAKFCKDHGVQEVHLFANAEEWNRGHLTREEADEYIRMFRQVLPILRRAGLAVSLNLWSTLLHCDRGRALRKGQNFERMVSPSGKVAKAMASPACPHWRKYIAELYGRMAKLGFEVLWLEDDFRYHNHAPLDWGGGFANAMLEKFSSIIGRKVSREEVVEKILKPGKPHPWRGLWLELWRKTSEENAAAIRDAVARSSPTASIGIMSSRPEVHSAEGRNWAGLFEAMKINNRAFHRPNFGSYAEALQGGLAETAAMLDLQKDFRPPWVKSYPEVENFPFGRFAKSDSLTFLQMALCQIYGSEGLLLDLFTFCGNSVREEPGIGELLDRSRPALEFLTRNFDRAMQSRGVGIPFKENAAEFVRTRFGKEMTELYPSLAGGPQILGSFGVSFQMRLAEEVNLLWGNSAWAFSDDEILRLLKRGLWLDAEAAEILQERGFGEHLGVNVKGWLDREEALYSIESAATRKSGLRPGFNVSVNHFGRASLLEPAEKSEVWTTLLDCYGKRLGPALTVFRNKLGGIVAVSAPPLGSEPSAWFKSFARQELTQSVIRRLAGKKSPVMATGGAYLICLCFESGRDRRVVVLNGSPDPQRPTLCLPAGWKEKETTLIEPLKRPRRGEWIRRGNKGSRILELRGELPMYGLAVARFRTG